MDRDNKLIIEALNSKFTKPVDISDSIKTQLGQAHGIIKGLIELLDRTPSGQTPYNEMAITHLVNLQEDLKFDNLCKVYIINIGKTYKLASLVYRCF